MKGLDRFFFVFVSALIGALGVWTILSQTAVFASMSFTVAPLLFWVSLLGGGLAGYAAISQPLMTVTSVLDPPSDTQPRWSYLRPFLTGAFAFGVAMAVAYYFVMPVIFFAVVLGFTAWGLRLTAQKGVPVPSSRPVEPMRPLEAMLSLGLLVTAMALPLLLHRVGADDANFLNLSAGLLADGRPMLAFDTMIGDPEQPIHLPSYRVETYHVLTAVVAQLTGASVIESAHLILPVIWSVLLLSIWVLFCRMAAGPGWMVALLVALTVLIGMGTSHISFGNFSFMRLQHGKAMLFTGIVPLVYIFAQRAWITRSAFDFGLLFLTVAAATSFSANGVFLMPIVGFIVATGLLLFEPRRLGTYLALGLACSWPVVAGLSILLTTGAYPSEFTEPIPMMHDVLRVYGAEIAPLAFVFCAGWTLLQGQIRRLFLGSFFVYSVIVLNPFLTSFFAENLTGNLNWRLMYAFPMPLFAGVTVAAALQLSRLPERRLIPAAAMALCLVALSPISILSDRNRVHWDPFGLDVPKHEYESATAMLPHLMKAGITLAPKDISLWLATFDAYPNQVAVRSVYLDHYRHTRSAEDIEARRLALKAVSGGFDTTDPTNVNSMLEALEQFAVTDVIIRSTDVDFEGLASVLDGVGFVEKTRFKEYRLFQRSTAPQS